VYRRVGQSCCGFYIDASFFANDPSALKNVAHFKVIKSDPELIIMLLLPFLFLNLCVTQVN
jgi:hypothetical protein